MADNREERHGRPVGHHTTGAIVRIYLKDFLTYSEVEVRPGPNLNLILGPNGTGKSTIVCAICLGLCGKTSTILRGAKVGDYVRHGTKQAVIEIELFNSNGRNYVITRTISKDTNHSQWKLQGKTVPQNQVETLVKGLHIQVDNLCQFLPQEQVQNFSRLKDKELLIKTLEAVGAVELLDDLNQLRELQDSRANATGEREKNEAELAKAREDNERWEGDVRSYQERKALETRCENLEKKQIWVEYSMANELYDRAKTEAERLMKQYKDAAVAFKPMEDRLEQIVKQMSTAERAIRKKREATSVSHGRVREKLDQVKHKKQAITGYKSELEAKRKGQAQTQQEIENQKRIIQSLETELENVEDESLLIPIIEEVDREMEHVSSKQSEAACNKDVTKDEMSNIRREKNVAANRLRELQNVGQQRMELLRRERPEVHCAVEWLRSNRHLFKHTIHEPLVLTLSVKDADMAKYVEHRISKNDMFAFFCEDKEDMNLLLKSVREQKGWGIGAVHAPAGDQPSSLEFQPRVSLSELQHFGFRAYLRDLITAPDPVMRYLCRNYQIHSIPVGNASTAQSLAAVRENYVGFFHMFYSDVQVFTMRRSRYSNQVSTQIEHLQRSRLLTTSVDPALIAAAEEEIRRADEKLVGLTSEFNHYEVEEASFKRTFEQLRQRKRELLARKSKRNETMTRLEAKKRQLERMKAQLLDMDAEEADTKKKCADQLRLIMGDLQKHAELLQQLLQLEKEREGLQILSDALKARASDLKQQVEEEKERYKQLEEEAKQAKELKETRKARAAEALSRACRQTGVRSYNAFPDDERAILDDLPAELNELEEALNEVKARIQCIRQTDPQIIQDYERRKRRIEELTLIVSNAEFAAAEVVRKIDEVRQRWLPPLNQLISRINDSFSRYYSGMNCAGEVALFNNDNADDFKSYGIKIRVKYRDSEPLQDLSAEHHSGGERAVATAMYMIALQELTQVPFRCVDEINQGMDAFNERRVFDLLVRTACHERTAQYFLLTPKLLSGLEYSRYMNILEIQNGPHLMSYKKWSREAHVAKLRSLRG